MPPHSGGMCGSQSPSAKACFAEPAERGAVGLAVGLLQPLLGDAHLGRADDVVDERADPAPELLELGGEAEVDAHGGESVTTPPSRNGARGRRSAGEEDLGDAVVERGVDQS